MFSIFFAIFSLFILLVCWLLGFLSGVFVVIYIAINVITFLVYGFDKFSSKNGMWRVSEKMLHYFSFFGGWIGAIFAQQWFRHKTQKKSFRFGFWITVFLNIILLLFYWVSLNSQKIIAIF